MAEFLTTKGIGATIENIIVDASREIVLISPFLQVSDTFFHRMKEALNRSVRIQIICREDKLDVTDYQLLTSLKHLELRFLSGFHAKCYYNENDMVITSMNLYDYSERNNVEMGIALSKGADRILFDKAMKECQSILHKSTLYKQGTAGAHAEPLRPVYASRKPSHLQEGHCIRCASIIPFNPNKPYCNECFSTWDQFGNPHYEENVCHACGDDHDATSMHLPLCSDCYGEGRGWKGNRKTG